MIFVSVVSPDASFDRLLHRAVAVMGAVFLASALLLAGALSPRSAAAQQPPDQEAFIGTWGDTVQPDEDGPGLRIFFHIERADDRALTGLMWSPDSFPPDRRFPMSQITVRGDSLSLEIQDAEGARFAGALSADGSTIEGTYVEGGGSYPLALTPAGESVSVPSPRVERPEADPADVKSIEAIVDALCEAFSGPGDETPDWERYRSLFLPGARIVEADHPAEGEPHYQMGTVEDYIETDGRYVETGDFREEAVHMVTERYGDIAQAFVTYEGRSPSGAAEPTFRGLGSLQLWHDGDRWWIMSVMWQVEREGGPIPERYQE